MTAATSDATSPWHDGEVALQRSVGVAEAMASRGRVVRSYLIDQHRAFYPLLPFILAGTVDKSGDAWATVLAGRPGFLQSPDPGTLRIAARRDPADPADAGLEDGDAIGLLGIELHTRRRNRLNGRVRRQGPETFDVTVEHSFGNCPQYIQQRRSTFVRDPATPAQSAPRDLERLDERARAMIGEADTFFVASYIDREDLGRQVDVSHRGGKPGFVRIGADGVLTIPDFAGNLHFNTLGNLLANPSSGLLFIDFESGDLLQLTGDAEIVLDSPEIAAFQGAERLWRFVPRRIVHRAGALPLRWTFEQDGWSPNSLMTGSWEDTGRRLKAAALARQWRQFRITRIVEESDSIRSFHLEPVDGAGLIPHAAGQHLPIRLATGDGAGPMIRTYTLSVAPSDGIYRISVKRQGLASTFLHGLKAGDVIEARAPAGQFTIDAAERRPAVLMAAGIGITPLLAMLRHIVYEGRRTRHTRPTWLLYSARSKADRAFDREIRELVDGIGAVRLIRLLSDPAGETGKEDYDVAGRIDIALLRVTLPFDDYDFYLCGPAAFTQALYDGLRGLSVADQRIHAEAFGPSSLQRTAAAAVPAGPAAATEPVAVTFAKSAKEARWTPASGSLLDLAESVGLAPEFSCRGGSCGTCGTPVLAGSIAYQKPPSFKTPADEALICCAVPAAGDRIVLDA